MIICSVYPEAMRLDRFFRAIFGPTPQSTLEKICRQKKIRVNGKAILPKTRVMARDEIDIEPSVIPTVLPVADKVSIAPNHDFQSFIVHDAENFCIINKPYGLSSQGGPGITQSVDKLAGPNYKIVHRLDRNTEGLMILAKNRPAATEFMTLFQDRKIQKYYYAIVRGRPEKDSGWIDFPLKNQLIDGDDKIVVDLDGQRALTRYRVVRILNRHHTLVLLKPLTGRKHQLRVHLATLGTPILGDSKYGKRAERMHLYAYKIAFPDFEYTHYE